MIIEDDVYLKFVSANRELSFPSDHIGFSISDNIHRLFSTMSATIKDQSGGFQEYLLNNPGNIVTAEFGLSENDFIKSHYIINKDSLNKLGENPTLFAGSVDIEFLHEWANYQREEEGFEEGRVSSVINTVISEYKFKKRDIESTDYSSTWYYGGKSKADFIRKVLIRKASSSSSDQTPFFAFIDTNNEFHFKSYKQMFGEPTRADFNLTLDRSVAQKDKFQSSIIDIKRFSSGLVHSKNNERIKFDTFTAGGDLEIEELKTENFLTKPRSFKYPLSNSNQQPMRSEFYYNGYLPDGAIQAEKIHSMRDDFFKERFLVLTPFNPKIRSGTTVNLDLTLPNVENDTYSERYSGKYLVEGSSHVWDGESKSAMTRLIITRKYVYVPEGYHMKGIMK